MSTRWLGIAMIIGTLAFIVQDLIYDVEMGNTSSRLALLLFCVGGICGVTGLIKLNALGSNTVARFYSLASARSDGFVEIVVRKHPGGLCSGQLLALRPGDTVQAFLRPKYA